jgi:hypothetical protein
MKLFRASVILAVIAGAACMIPGHASAAPVHVGIAIGVPAPVVAYPAPVYYPPPYYAPAPVYGPVVAPPPYGHYRYHRAYRHGYGHYRGPYRHHR